MISQPKSRKSLVFLTILLLPVKIRKPVFISVKHLSVLGAPGGCNHSVPSSSLGWPPLRFSFVTMITWFSYQINCIITCSRSDVDDFLIIFIVLYVTSLLVLQTGIEISYIPKDLITVIFYYQISLNPLKTQSLSQVSFPLLFPLRYIVPPVFTNSDKGKNKGKKII